MNDLSDDEAFVGPPPPQRTVFDYVRLLDAKAVDRLFGKGTSLDPDALAAASSIRMGSRALSAGAPASPAPEPGADAVPWTCRALLQALSPLAQHICLRLAYCRFPVSLTDISKVWCHTDRSADAEAAIEELIGLHLAHLAPTTAALSADAASGGGSNGDGSASSRKLSQKRQREVGDGLTLNSHFGRGLRATLASAQPVPWLDPANPLKRDKQPCTAQDVDAHMHQRWNQVLTYMVSPRSSGTVGSEVKKFLVRSKFIVLRSREDDEDEAAAEVDDEEDEDEDEDVQAESEEDEEDKGPRYKIGPRGYEFLLQDMHVQMWRFVEEFIKPPAGSGKGGRRLFAYAPEMVLRFLFSLAACSPGQDYPVKSLAAEEVVLLDHLSRFGFVLRRTRADGTPASRFYPSTVACRLVDGFRASAGATPAASGSALSRTAAPVLGSAGASIFAPSVVPSAMAAGSTAAGATATTSSGGASAANLSHFEAIVQTNFQVVAYTTNELHLKMLGLFAQLRAFLPNAVVATLTRKSINDALQDGISASQVLRFLETNAHPHARARAASAGSIGSTVPPTVRDQLLLWEQERNRLTARRGVLMGFEMPQARFAALVKVLETKHLLLWQDSRSRRLVVRDGFDEEVAQITEAI